MYLIQHSFNPFYYSSREHNTIATYDDYDTALEAFLTREACDVYHSERVMCVYAHKLQNGFIVALN